MKQGKFSNKNNLDLSFKKNSKRQKDQKEIDVIRCDYNYYFDLEITEEIKTPRNIKKLPTKNKTGIYFTTNNIYSSEIIDRINEENKIVSIDCTFVVIDKKNLAILEKYNINRIGTRFYYGKYEKYNEIIKKLNYSEKIILNSHVKNFLIKCENNIFYSVVTSTNPKLSDQLESYIIVNSEEYYNNLQKYYNQEKSHISLCLPKENNVYGFFDVYNKTNIDLLKLIAKNEKIEDISFFIYGTGKKNLILLKKFIDKNKIKNVNFYLSGFLKRMLKYTLDTYKDISNKIYYFNHHTKIILVKTNKNYYFINSTENLDSKSKIEHTEIYNNKDIYMFAENFAQKHFE